MSNDYTPGGTGLGNIDPAMLTQLLQYLITQGGQPSWQGAADPQLLNQLSFGFSPTQMQAGSIPMIPGSQDEGDRGFVEEASKQANYAQDVGDLAGIGDIMPALFGPGGYSADSFAPTVTNELIQQPATLQFQRYLDPANAGTFEGRVAQVIQGGGTVSDAVAQMRQVVENADTHPDDAQAQADADLLRPYLQTNTVFDQTNTAQQVVDWQAVLRQAQDLVDPYLAEQSIQLGPTGATYDPATGKSTPGGEIVNIDGQLYRQTSTPSPLADAFREAGIPLPTEQYSPADILGPDFAQAEDAYISALPGLKDLYAQYQNDITQANDRATTLGQLSPDLFNGGQIPGAGGPSDHVTPRPGNALGGIGQGIVDNAAGRVREEAGSAATTAGNLALGGADLLGHAGGWSAGALRSMIGNLIGTGSPDTGSNTEPGGETAVRTLDEGAAAQAAATRDEFAGIGGGGAGGAGGPRTLADLGGQQPIIPANMQLGGSGQPQPPGPGDPNSYLDYVMSASPGNRLSYQDWLVQQQQMAEQAQQQAGAQYNVPGQAPVNADVSGPPVVGAGMSPAGSPNLTGYEHLLAQLNRGVPRHADYNTNTVTGHNAGGQIDITQLPSTMPPQPQPVTGEYNTNTQTGYPTGQPVMPMSGPVGSPYPWMIDRGQTPGANNPATRGPGGQTSGPAGGQIDEAAKAAMRDAMLAAILPSVPPRTQDDYLNQSEETGRGVNSESIWNQLWPGGAPAPQPGRTNDTPTGGPVGGRGSFWDTLFSSGPNDPRSRTNATATSAGRSSATALRLGNRGQTSAGHRDRRAEEVLDARRQARGIEDQARETRYAQNMAYRNIRGRDYWMARGYTEQLARMGITPTQVALANRTGGINAMFGR